MLPQVPSSYRNYIPCERQTIPPSASLFHVVTNCPAVLLSHAGARLIYERGHSTSDTLGPTKSLHRLAISWSIANNVANGKRLVTSSGCNSCLTTRRRFSFQLRLRLEDDQGDISEAPYCPLSLLTTSVLIYRLGKLVAPDQWRIVSRLTEMRLLTRGRGPAG